MYENCIFNENFIDAISYIKLLKDEGVIFDRRPATISGGEELKLKPEQVGATARLNSEYEFYGGISIGMYLSGINTENIVENSRRGICFAVLRGTDRVSDKMNGFLNLLMSDPNSYMDFYYGIQDVHYTEETDYFNIKTQDDAGNNIHKGLSIHIGLNDMGFSEKYALYNGVDFRLKFADLTAQLEEARSDIEEIDDAVRYTIPLYGYDSRLDILREKTYSPTRDFCRSVLSSNVPIETAIESYRKKLEVLKVFDIIDEMNMDLN